MSPPFEIVETKIKESAGAERKRSWAELRMSHFGVTALFPRMGNQVSGCTILADFSALVQA